MVSSPTTLIVGAGGSRPYGFPLGERLVQTIAASIDAQLVLRTEPGSNAFTQLLLASGANPEELLEFKRELTRAQPFSIDAFLESRPEFLSVGRLCIACALAPLENIVHLDQIHLSEGFPDQNWYKYLANRLRENLLAGMRNELWILTYNYDRSLDQYLHDSLQASLKNRNDLLACIEQNLKIVHMHGSIGKLPFDAGGTGFVLPYGAPIGDYSEAAREIKIIHEAEEDSAEYTLARQFLERSTLVWFLGFGFHRKNVERLMKGGSWQRRIPKDRLGSTVFGLTESEKKIALRPFTRGFDIANQNCLQFLRDRVHYLA